MLYHLLYPLRHQYSLFKTFLTILITFIIFVILLLIASFVLKGVITLFIKEKEFVFLNLLKKPEFLSFSF